jgi:hypothetical protein
LVLLVEKHAVAFDVRPAASLLSVFCAEPQLVSSDFQRTLPVGRRHLLSFCFDGDVC